MLRVYKICLDNKITFCELSKVLNMSYTSVGYMLKGKLDITLDNLKKIKNFLVGQKIVSESIDLGWLLDIV